MPSFSMCFPGVDESMVVAMKFSRNRVALCAFSIATWLPNDAVICGTGGYIKVCGAGLCKTTLRANSQIKMKRSDKELLPRVI